MRTTIDDTYQLLKHDDLMKAVAYLEKAPVIYIIAITDISGIAYDFMYKMRYLKKKVEICNNPEDFYHIVNIMNEDDCIIFISYSGETFHLFDIQLNDFQCQNRIAISSIGHNSLNDYCQCHLSISTREKLSSKIASYVSNQSVYYILNILFSCLFLKDFDHNYKMKLDISKQIDFNRKSSTEMISEEK